MTARQDAFDAIDFSQERDLDGTTMLRPRRNRRRAVIATAVAVCFGLGLALGYALAWRSERSEGGQSAPAVSPPWRGPGESAPSGAVGDAMDLAAAERLIESRLAAIAFQEAHNTVDHGVLGGDRVLQAVAETPGTQEMPVRIESSQGPVRVRVDGREVEPVAQDVYRVRRSQPVQVEFIPAPPGLDRAEYFELVVTPLLELDQYDPYVRPRRR